MSLAHVSYEISSSLSLPSPKRAKPSNKKLQKKNSSSKLGKVKKVEPQPVEPTGNQSPTLTFRRRLSFLLHPRPQSAPVYPTDTKYDSISSRYNPLATPPVVPVSSTSSIGSTITTSSPAFSRSVSPTPSLHGQSPSPSTPRPLSRRHSWPISLKRGASRLSLDISNFFDQTNSTTRTHTQEIEDFLAGGRENPNPCLYEADMIRCMDGLELMTLSQMQHAENVTKEVELERCHIHQVMTGKGKCSRCAVERLQEEIKEEIIMRRRVQSSWLQLDDE
ncbi:hypothetical protein L211DRAFT_237374 [Terfezia boudieri ATCC MYA-4762]|uniref:Uncharacterized protein n=1 Tax=Terfezia boudieri ATCC MYA-4762 TaxID=1051890 RepID=A0A3N4M7I2_9PEZI|nr:hypothetical protein L211DRAFT_237374 [Terfezia boudieri ATCC MYA-4762]